MKKLFVCILVCLVIVGIMSGCDSVAYRPTKITLVWETGHEEMEIDYYKSGGCRVDFTRSYDGETDDYKHHTIYTCDENGNAIKMEWFYEGETTPFRTTTISYYYDSNGNLIEREEREKEGEQKNIFYDEYGNEQIVKYVNENGKWQKEYLYEYDSNGNILEKRVGSEVVKYVYDKSGTQIKEECCSNGNVDTTTFSYDKHGNIVEFENASNFSSGTIKGTIQYEKAEKDGFIPDAFAMMNRHRFEWDWEIV